MNSGAVGATKLDVYRYIFPDDRCMGTTEELLLLAIVAVESLRGDAVVRLDAAYHLDEQRRTCVVDGGTDVGQNIARIFTGFLTREFGEDGFRVTRLNRGDESVSLGDLARWTGR